MVYYPQIEPERGIIMKKLAPVCAALLALTACTAAPETPVPAATEPPAETTATEEATATEQFPVGTLHLTTFDNTDGTALYGGTSNEYGTVWTILRLDYATGVQSKLCDIDFTGEKGGMGSMFTVGENEAVFWSNEGETQCGFTMVHPDGTTEEKIISQSIAPTVYDEYAAYEIKGTDCRRMDWQTGEVTYFTSPLRQLHNIEDVVNGKLLISRIVSDMPLPTELGQEEMYDAVLQNSLLEYDLYDLAANTLEKLFDEPYYYAVGSTSWKSYAGHRDGALYFVETKWDTSTPDTCDNALRSYDIAAGTWQDVYTLTGKQGSYCPSFSLDGQLEYVLLWQSMDTLTLYKLADGTTHDVPYRAAAITGTYGTGENYGWPVALTGDGRFLVTDGYAKQVAYTNDGYALIDVDAYLSGSTDYTPVQMWEE